MTATLAACVVTAFAAGVIVGSYLQWRRSEPLADQRHWTEVNVEARTEAADIAGRRAQTLEVIVRRQARLIRRMVARELGATK